VTTRAWLRIGRAFQRRDRLAPAPADLAAIEPASLC